MIEENKKIIFNDINDFNYFIGLQFFAEEGGAGEKTEEPTPRRKEKAREKGDVPSSNDLVSGLILLFTVIFLRFYVSLIYRELYTTMYNVLTRIGDIAIKIGNVYHLASYFMLFTAKLLSPILGLAFFIAIAGNYIQKGPIFTMETMRIQFNKLNPIEGIKKIFSLRTIVEFLKTIFKVMIIGTVSGLTVFFYWEDLIKIPDLAVVQSVFLISRITFDIWFRVALVLVGLGVLDFFYQKFEHTKKLKMTKQELKEEYKEHEIDPHIKQKIKRRQQEIATRRMLEEVPEADVVITNPTHYAVAIKYLQGVMEAPQLIAKGKDLMAYKIKEIAREHNIEIVENKPLAQALYFSCDIGEFVPENLWQAVAEILSFVYQKKEKGHV